MSHWHRIVIAAVVFGVVFIVERLLDSALRHRRLPPEAETRYRILRRALSAVILVAGFFAALLVIPEVRAAAGAVLASGALLAIIVGIAAQRTLGNFIAGISIALAQPIRLGDRVTYAGVEGVIEEVGLTYTFIRVSDGSRLVVPNDKLAADTIVNSTIHSRETFAEITIQLPLTCDLAAAVAGLREEVAPERDSGVAVSALGERATVTVRAAAPDAAAAERLEGELRLRAHTRLRSLGVFT
jgi:small-conductance mechanosensitive channel